MKQAIMMGALLLLMSGCAAKEATYTDQRFGMANYSMHKQIIMPSPQSAQAQDGVRSMDAERMMQALNNSYYTPVRLDISKFEISSGQK